MKSEEEIQEAHDFLGAILQLDNVERVMDKKVYTNIHVAYDTLCFVLEHDHNPAFSFNLNALRKLADDSGLRLVRYISNAE